MILAHKNESNFERLSNLQLVDDPWICLSAWTFESLITAVFRLLIAKPGLLGLLPCLLLCLLFFVLQLLSLFLQKVCWLNCCTSARCSLPLKLVFRFLRLRDC